MYFGELVVGTVLGLVCTYPLAWFALYGDAGTFPKSRLWMILSAVVLIHVVATFVANSMLHRGRAGVAWVAMLFPAWIAWIAIGIAWFVVSTVALMFR
jgi:uncharacterized membrane protein